MRFGFIFKTAVGAEVSDSEDSNIGAAWRKMERPEAGKAVRRLLW